MTKRACKYIVDLKDSSDSAELQICGVIGEISPIKKGQSASYFDGKMSNGKAKVCLFGFDDSLKNAFQMPVEVQWYLLSSQKGSFTVMNLR